MRRAAQAGVLAGFPTSDFQATLLDGSFHERDSSTLAFELAAAAAFRDAAAKADAGSVATEVGPISVSRPVYAVISTGLEQDRTGARKNLDRSELAFLCVPIIYDGQVVGVCGIVALMGEDVGS